MDIPESVAVLAQSTDRSKVSPVFRMSTICQQLALQWFIRLAENTIAKASYKIHGCRNPSINVVLKMTPKNHNEHEALVYYREI